MDIYFKGIIEIGSTGGTFKLRYYVASDTYTIKKGAYLKLTKLN